MDKRKVCIDKLCEHLQLYKHKDGTLTVYMIAKLVYNLAKYDTYKETNEEIPAEEEKIET